MIRRPESGRVAQVPFAHDGRLISQGFEHFGDRHFFEWQAMGVLDKNDLMRQAAANGILAGQ